MTSTAGGGAGGSATAASKPALGPIEPQHLEALVDQAVAWTAAHGMMMSKERGQAHQVPFSLLPVPYPRLEFRKAQSYSPIFSRLVDKISRDIPWLLKALSSTLEKDEFTARLVKILKTVHGEGLRQDAYLGVFRSDYMLHEPEGSNEATLLQVEINTISASFGALGSLTGNLHRFVVERFGGETPGLLPFLSLPDIEPLSEYIPENTAIREIPRALADAHRYYNAPRAAVLFIVQEGEVNSIDQRWLEYKLWENHKVKVIRRTLGYIASNARLEGADQILMLDGTEISVGYFRAAYTPKDFYGEKEWDALLLLERSKAILCPSVAYHLAGTKKVQQILARKGELEKFISPEESATLRQCFAGLWGLEKEDAATANIIEDAIKNPGAYVMKPQREGGGNNIYGEDVKTTLEKMDPVERASYILMARIVPKTYPSALVKSGNVVVEKTISELGMYAVCLFDGGKEVFNRHAGHLVRSKMETVNEGGVATGYAVLNSPLLLP